MISLIKSFFGAGYKPCNEEADIVLTACAERPVAEVVAAPWFASGTGLNATGRLSALAAIGAGTFGLAKRGSGRQAHYKFYYRRELTGFWLAEVWPAWKSALYAAPLVILAMVFSASPMQKLIYDNAAAPADSLGCFLLGLIMTLMFLIRGWLGLGCQYQVAQTTGRSFAEPAGLINLSVGLYGLNLMLLTLFQDWSVSTLAGEIFDSLAAFVTGSNSVYRESFLFRAFRPIAMVGVMALMILTAAAAFWYVSFQYYGARRAGEIVSIGLPFRTAVMEALYPYSFQQVAAHFRAPQIAFGGLAYVVFVLGFANAPFIIWLSNLF